jgi:ferredoxin
MGPQIWHIDPQRCTECVGHFDTPQCVAVCPVECIHVDPQRQESRATLQVRYEALQAARAETAAADGE